MERLLNRVKVRPPRPYSYPYLHAACYPRTPLLLRVRAQHFLRAVLGACLQLGDEAAMRELAINQFSGLFAEDSQASYGSDGMD